MLQWTFRHSKMSAQTIEILTNKELIAINQDKACRQAERISNDNQVELWVKPLFSKKEKAVAIFNRNDKAVDYVLTNKSVQVGTKAKLRDLWLHADLGKMGVNKAFRVPAHGIVVLKVNE